MLDKEINTIIQQISSIFVSKNIPAAPLNLKYLGLEIPIEQQVLVLKELIIYLDDLMVKYEVEHGKKHKYYRYNEYFQKLAEENIEDSGLTPRPKPRKKEFYGHKQKKVY